MTTDTGAVRRFFRTYAAAPVGDTPTRPDDSPPEPSDAVIDRAVEMPEDSWAVVIVPEQPIARPGEFPERFVDGSITSQPVLCVRSPAGWPIPLLLGEVGAVVLTSVGRKFEREFVAVERVLSFVADPFPWAEVEAFATELQNKPELRLRVLPANRPAESHNPFDYDLMRTQARARMQQEMSVLERFAVAAGPGKPTLVDGPLDRVVGSARPDGPLVVGVVKRQSANYLHDGGQRTLLDLKPGQRSPVFRITREGSLDVATWYLKLAGGPRLAPNWGTVRVEVPWVQFVPRGIDFVGRLSRWLIDARCRAAGYARMPVSLEPIVRAEDAIKPLFTPLQMLVNRLYRTAGLFRGNES